MDMSDTLNIFDVCALQESFTAPGSLSSSGDDVSLKGSNGSIP